MSSKLCCLLVHPSENTAVDAQLEAEDFMDREGLGKVCDSYEITEADIVRLSTKLKANVLSQPDPMLMSDHYLMAAIDERNKDWFEYGENLRRAGDCANQYFSMVCTVFNTEAYDWSIPSKTKGWFVVPVHMHD